MPTPHVCVLRAPGTNCDPETAHAFALAGAQVDRVHLFRILEQPHLLKNYQVLCFPGGFSYGDDVGAGVVFGSQLRGQLADALQEFLARDTLCLGICNGFQVLVKAGILPGGAANFPQDPATPPAATLTWNQNGRYTALWVRLRACSALNVFLRDIDQIELPIAHAEGRIVPQHSGFVEEWRSSGQLALCYADENGRVPREPLAYPLNPNGSTANIAGLGDATGRVLGLMPHPERFLFATQHPQWTRHRLSGAGAGLKIFENAVQYFG